MSVTAFHCAGYSTNMSEETFPAQRNFKHKEQKSKGISTHSYKIKTQQIADLHTCSKKD